MAFPGRARFSNRIRVGPRNRSTGRSTERRSSPTTCVTLRASCLVTSVYPIRPVTRRRGFRDGDSSAARALLAALRYASWHPWRRHRRWDAASPHPRVRPGPGARAAPARRRARSLDFSARVSSRRRIRASASPARSCALSRAPCSTTRACPGTPTWTSPTSPRLPRVCPTTRPRPARPSPSSPRACWTPCVRSTRTRCTTSAWWTCPPSASRSAPATCTTRAPRWPSPRTPRRWRASSTWPCAVASSAGFARLCGRCARCSRRRPTGAPSPCGTDSSFCARRRWTCATRACAPRTRPRRAPSPTSRRCTLTSPWTPCPTSFPTRRRARRATRKPAAPPWRFTAAGSPRRRAGRGWSAAGSRPWWICGSRTEITSGRGRWAAARASASSVTRVWR